MARTWFAVILVSAVLGSLAGLALLVLRPPPRLEVSRPQPLDLPQVPDPAVWDTVRLVISGGLDLHLFPRFGRQQQPLGGVARVASLTRHFRAESRQLTLGLHVGLDDRATPPVPEDAAEEPVRRRAEILEHLRQAGIEVLARRDPAGAMRLFQAGPAGWAAGEDQGVVQLGDRVTIGLALFQDEPWTNPAAELRRQGARINLLVLEPGASRSPATTGFDFVVVPSPHPSYRPGSSRELLLSPGGISGWTLDLLLPRGQDSGRLESFQHYLDARLAGQQFDAELAVSDDSPAKLLALVDLRRRALASMEACRSLAFFTAVPRPMRGLLRDDDPGVMLEKLHWQRDRELYGPVVDSRREDHRTPGHPGTSTCQACHPEAWEAWSATAHARAFTALEPLGAQRSPACVTCHSTGFDPAGQSGWARMSEFRGHENVGCTACHLPGEPNAKPSHPWGKARGCQTCHTSFSDPGFDEAEGRWLTSCTVLMRSKRGLQ